MRRIRTGRTSPRSYRQLLFHSSWVWIFAFFFLVAGISCGAFTEVLMTPAQKTMLTEYLSQYLSVNDLVNTHYRDIFIGSLKNNLMLLALMALLCLIGIGFPVTFILLFCKGAVIGFTSALLIENMTYKGTVLTFVSMVPQNLIIVPAMYMSTVVCANLALLVISGGLPHIPQSLSRYAGTFLTSCGALAFAFALGAFIEAFICPFLTKLVV